MTSRGTAGDPPGDEASLLLPELLCYAKDLEWLASRNADLEALCQDLTKVSDDLVDQVCRDSLTGLVNRRLLTDRLRQRMLQSEHSQASLGLLFIDLDHFRHIVDSLGQDWGNLALLEAARRLGSMIRPDDILARLGVDEFVLLVPQLAKPEELHDLARKLGAVLGKPMWLDSSEYLLSASIGGAFYPDDGRDAEQLLHRSRMAMYRAKNRGGHNYQAYSDLASSAPTLSIDQGAALAEAISRRQLVVVYQPRVPLSDEFPVISIEAQLRWLSPAGETITGLEVFGQAHALGYPQALCDWLLHEACRQFRDWQARGLTGIRWAVEVPHGEIPAIEQVDMLLRALSTSGINPDDVDLEARECEFLCELVDDHCRSQMLSGVSVTQPPLDARGILRQRPLHRLKIIPADTSGGYKAMISKVWVMGLKPLSEWNEQLQLVTEGGEEPLGGKEELLLYPPLPEAGVVEWMRQHSMDDDQPAPQSPIRRLLKACLSTLGLCLLCLMGGNEKLLAAQSPESVILAVNAEYGVRGSHVAQSVEQGVRLAIAEINQAGGVLGGRTLAIETRDDRGVPMRAVDHLRELAANPAVLAVFCGRFSPVALELVPVANREGILLLDPWAAAEGIANNGSPNNFVFRLSLTDSWALRTLLEDARERGFSRLSAFLPNTGWGRSSDAAINAFAELHPELSIQKSWYNWGDTQFTSMILDARAFGAEAVLMVANETEGSSIVRQVAELPVNQRMPLLSHWGITGGDFIRVTGLGPNLGGVDFRVVQSFTFSGLINPVAERVAASYRQHFGSEVRDLPAQAGFAHAYDMVHLLVQAINRAGSVDRQAVRDALEHLGDHQGLVRDYHQPFGPGDHEALDPGAAFLAYYDNEGQLKKLMRNKP